MPRGRILVTVVGVLVLAAIACGGGGVQQPEPVAQPTAAPSPTPPPIPTLAVAPATATAETTGTDQSVATGAVESSLLYGSTRDGVMGLYYLSVDSRNAGRLFPADEGLQHLIWPDMSPSGDKVAAAAVQGNVDMRPEGIFVMNLDGSGVTQVTFGEGTHPSWSPDSTQIAYTCEDGMDVCVANVDGSSRVNLTEDSDLIDRYPDWTADGRIVFMSNRDTGGPGFSELYVMNADGSDVTRLTTDESAYNAHPNVYREGGLIVYETDRDVTIGSELYIMDLNGGGQRRLTNDTQWNQAPVWSPDGTQILFSQQGEKVSLDIFVVDASGAGLSQLTEHPAEDGGLRLGYDWLSGPTPVQQEFVREDRRTYDVDVPRGSPPVTNAVLFAADNINCDDCLSTGIYAVNFDGANLTKLTLDGAYPAWDPDFERVAYTKDGELWISNTDGTSQTQMTQTYMGLTAPRWDDRGLRIALDCTPYGQHDICLFDVGKGDINNITIEDTHDPGVAYPTWFEDNFILGSQIVNPQGSPFDSLPAPGPVSPSLDFSVGVIDGQVVVTPFDDDAIEITDSDSDKAFPVWGPNNDLVVYTEYPGDGKMYLWMARADGSASFQLVEAPIGLGGTGTWLGYSWAP